MSSRSIAFALLLLILPVIARAGDVLKVDDSLVAGDLVSFDGSNLQVQGYGDTAATFRVTIPIQEIVRVRFQTVAPPPVAVNPSARSTNPVPAPVVLPSVWQLNLAGNDVVSGALRSWTEDQFTIDIQQGRAILQIPTQSIREIWRAAPELVRKARDLKAASTGDDIAYVVKDSEIVPVKGTVLGVQNLSLGFLYEGQERKISVDKLLGVVFATRKRSATTGPAGANGSFIASFRLLNGDVLSGRWTQLKDGFVSFSGSWDQTVQLPVTSIASIDVHNRGLVWLSELKPVRVEQTPYFDRVIPWRIDTSLDGGPLKLNDGQQYARGIAMHSRCVLEYDLQGDFQQFQARFGFEPMSPGSPVGRAAVRVMIDGRTQFENSDARGDERPKDLTLDVRGAKRLALEVDFGRDQDAADRIVWANARLIRAGAN